MAADFKQKHDFPPDMAPPARPEPIPVQGQFRTEMDMPNATAGGDSQCSRLKRKITGSVLQTMPDGTTRRWDWHKRR